MKYWSITGSKAILKRQVRNNNNKLVNHSFNNILIGGIRFLIKNDNLISDLERAELLFEI